MVSTTTHTIRVESIPQLEVLVRGLNHKISKLNKRHDANLSLTYFKVLGTREITQADARRADTDNDEGSAPSSHSVGTVVVDVEVIGEKPVLAGWAIVGILTATDEGYLVSRVWDAKYADVAPFASRGGECDHCKASRRRTTTYLLRQTSEGEPGALDIKIIGSTCLKDFTGHMAPSLVAGYADYSVGFDAELAELEDLSNEERHDGGWGGGYRTAIPLVKYLAFARQSIRESGWLSKTQVFEQGYGQPTSSRAWERQSLVAQMRRSHAAETNEEAQLTLLAEIVKFSPETEDVTGAINDLSLVDDTFSTTETPSDFEQNTLTVVRQGYAFGKNLGIAAAICRAAERIRANIERKADRAAQRNEHFGTVGKREVFSLTLVFATEIEGAFGSTQLCIFRDDKGRTAKWFNSGSSRLDKGTVYQLKSTVKKHGEYTNKSGVKVLETMLSRCVVMSEVKPEEAKAS